MTILLMCFLSCQREPHCATCYDTNTGEEWRICEPTAFVNGTLTSILLSKSIARIDRQYMIL